ncbi:Rad52/Rad22 family DNA repair protein [Anaerobutyricum hallii]|uniref:Rad52/Rad22 family DNA repair protein n=1 Tax=Anaerobutyricum hallii TaxID=39488 RepID=UPI00267378C2|nr:Rad52/Rad22 family DNA repair protein [Anaerobutyricum hallii]
MNGALFCTVSIKDENGEWISKQDVGVESYTEAVKGAASDSFKRACFNIGIGRELYTAPFIWIPSDKVSIAEGNGKLKVRDSFNVSYISYDENGKVIKSLEIRNQKNEIVCQFNMGNKVPKQVSQTANKNQLSDYRMKRLYDEMERTGVTEQKIVERFHVSLANITERDYKRIMSALKNTDTRAA